MPSFPPGLSAWRYRKKITISGSSGAGTNYQVLLKVGESSGASGADFHLNGLSANFPSATNDGGDLRFTASDGVTLLNFWVDRVTGTSPNRVAYIYVKVSANLDTNQDIYCYFGNLDASNASNGFNTFLFFDNFDDNSIDTTKWTVLNNVAEQNQRLEVTVDSNGAVWNALQMKSDITFTPPFKVHVDVLTDSTITNSGWEFHMGEDGIGGWGQGFGYYNGAWNYPGTNGGAGTWTSPPSVSPNTWYELIEKLPDPTHSYAFINGIQYGSKVFTTALSDIRYGIGATNQKPKFDNFFIAKYVSPEPAFSGAGGLEKRSSIVSVLI